MSPPCGVAQIRYVRRLAMKRVFVALMWLRQQTLDFDER